MMKKTISLLLCLISLTMMATTSFATQPTYNQEVINIKNQFEAKIGREITLPSWVPLNNPVVKATYEDNFNRLALYYSVNKSKAHVEVYIEAKERNLTLKNRVIAKNLEKGMQGFYIAPDPVINKFVSQLAFNFEDACYVIFFSSNDITSKTAEDTLIKIANSIIRS